MSNKVRILVVEDELINQMMLKLIFREVDVEAEIVDTGNAALQMMNDRHHEFSLVFMDLGLPDTCGIAVTKQIRENENKKGLKNKFICAYTASPEKEEECFEAGMDAFLEKPMTIEKLKVILKKIGSTNTDSQVPAYKDGYCEL